MSEGIRVRVLVTGQFNGPDHKNLPGWSQVGEEIVVAGGGYAESLREDGLVAFADTTDERAALENELASLQATLDALDLEQSVVEELTHEQEVDAQAEADQQTGGQFDQQGQEADQAKSVTPKRRGKRA